MVQYWSLDAWVGFFGPKLGYVQQTIFENFMYVTFVCAYGVPLSWES